MLPRLPQFKYFNNSARCRLFRKYMSEKYPKCKVFFEKPHLGPLNGYMYDGDSDIDTCMAFHEFAHIMDVFNRNKPESMWLLDFGYPRTEFIPSTWSRGMIKNELWVFVVADYFYRHSGHTNALFTQPMVSDFLAVYLLKVDPYLKLNHASNVISEMFDECRTLVEPVIDDLTNRTIEYMLTYEHK